MIKKWDERIVPAAPPCVEEEEIHMAMLAEIDELRAKLAAAETSANELRRAVAELIGADPETWPNHGNAPLAIAACVAVRQAELAALESQDTRLKAELNDALATIELVEAAGAAVQQEEAAKYIGTCADGAAPVPEGWQPIETAPKDGLPFRAYSKDLIDLDFNPNGSVECCWDGAEFVGCVWDGQQDAWYGKAISPTHWMLLPAAPKDQL